MKNLFKKPLFVMFFTLMLCTVAFAAYIYTTHTMTGHGTNPPTAQWIPDNTDWGYVEVGTEVQTTILLKNTGKLTIAGTVALAPECPNVFNIVSGSGPYVLTPGGSKEVVISFAPTDTLVYECIIRSGP